MIVLVWISSPSTSTSEILVYVDTLSSHTFAYQEVCRELQTKMEPVKLSLSSLMERNSAIQSNRVTSLRVRGFSSDVCIDLPPVYTRESIPLECFHITMSKTATKWKHFATITQEMPSLMKCSVGLLIGYDCSSALASWKVIMGADQEPYAIKTDLGWSIVGKCNRLHELKCHWSLSPNICQGTSIHNTINLHQGTWSWLCRHRTWWAECISG